MITSPIDTVRKYLQGDGAIILPELELFLFALGILIIDRWIEAKEKYWNAVLAFAGICFSGFTLWLLRSHVEQARADWGDPILLGFHDTAIVDPMFLFMAVIFLAVTALVILLSVRYLRTGGELQGKYYALLLFACIGMLLTASGVDAINLFLGVEVMAVSFYALTGFLQKEKRSREAAVKLMLFGLFGSAVLVYGFTLLYGMFGTFNIGRIGAMLDFGARRGMPFGGFSGWIATFAFATIVAASFVKIAAVPFHVWAPDVYEGSPTPVAALVSTAGITAVFVLLLRVFVFVFIYAHEAWVHLVAAVAVASLVWGNFAALLQKNLKRMLAYSAIAQVGFILLGFVAGNEAGFVGVTFSLQVYVFMMLGAFAVVIVLEQSESSAVELDGVRGLYWRSPVAAILLAVFLMSIAGIPPTGGFLTKYALFKALIGADAKSGLLQSLIHANHPVLAGFAAISVPAALYYHLRVVVYAWRKRAEEAALPLLTISSGEAIVLGVALFVSLVAGLYSGPFVRLAHYAFGQ
jgi:NADH-quinone oxidoreductase subunit N